MVFQEITTKEVFDTIILIKHKGSSGPDGISNQILKLSSTVISEPLSKLFNQCIKQGTFPNALKIAKVLPFYKDGNCQLPESYRPISLLNSISKVFEKIIFGKMYKFLRKYRILTPEQYGFQPKKNCADALLEFTEFIREVIDKRRYGETFFIDFQKAFDTINHELLILKLDKYGIRGKLNKLIRSYLTDRKQYVAFDQKESRIEHSTCGVPQGSILGPLLFLIFITDLPIVCNTIKLVLYADDTTLCYSSTTRTNKFENEMKNIEKWIDCNGLTINCKKSVFMKFGKNVEMINVFGDNFQSNYQLPVKYLGLKIDNKLSFKQHICGIVKKLSTFCGIVYKCREVFPRASLLLFYRAYAQSVIQYGILIYGNTYKTHLDSILKLQKRITRALFFKRKFEPITQYMSEHKIYSVFNMFLKSLFKELFEILRCPNKNSFLSLSSLERLPHTRSKTKKQITIIAFKSNAMKFSLKRRLAIAYNFVFQNNLLPKDFFELNKSELNRFQESFFRNYILIMNSYTNCSLIDAHSGDFMSVLFKFSRCPTR